MQSAHCHMGSGALLVLAMAGYAFISSVRGPERCSSAGPSPGTALEKNAAMARFVPSGISVIRDCQYARGDKDAKLDVYFPSNTENSATGSPTIVWVHGGAWLAEQVGDFELSEDPGLTRLHGRWSELFTRARSHLPKTRRPTWRSPRVPAGQRPRPSRRSNRILIAGDSAGAQISSQYGLIVSDPSYAAKIGIRPALERSQLRGLILCCGPYDAGAVNMSGAFGGFLRIVMWSYSGTRDFATTLASRCCQRRDS